jgi:DNA-binding response OmpR family regulator
MDKVNKVLIVDDDDQISKMYTTHLEIKGFQTMRVANGEDALATTIEFKPDAILLDVMMPKISGFDVLDILKNTKQTASIPIIMLTALSAPEDREKALKLGADEYLEKSTTDLPTILEKINKLISK